MTKSIFFLFCAGALSAGSACADEPQNVAWQDLTVSIQFEDPFEALETEQLMNLRLVARVRDLQTSRPESVSDSMQEEAEAAATALLEQGINMDGLLARRAEITGLRKKRATAVNADLDGKAIRMAGYALALEYDGKRITEFLLVPWVGACIHTPPPPPNQILHVTAKESVAVHSRFEPVWVEGILRTGALRKTLYLVDGSDDINIGYAMDDASVSPYTSAAP